MAETKTPFPYPIIALEEHALFPPLSSSTPFYDAIWEIFPHFRAALSNHSSGRLTDMSTGAVSLQVMSHLPGIASNNSEGCREANNAMAAAVGKHPGKYQGFATLPMAVPQEAAAELERTVRDLGLVGAMVDDHLEDGKQYDDRRFWPVFETAEKLDAPIYIHPAPPSQVVVKERYEGNYNEAVTMGLATGAWGWHSDVGLHVLKLYGAGVFQAFPKLKVIIGHMGEMLPMMIDRVEDLKFFKKGGLPGFRDVWEKNIWVTSSGMFSIRALEMLKTVLGMERIMYSVDTPFNPSEKGLKFLEELEKSKVLTEEEMEGFVGGNAKRLLKI